MDFTHLREKLLTCTSKTGVTGALVNTRNTNTVNFPFFLDFFHSLLKRAFGSRYHFLSSPPALLHTFFCVTSQTRPLPFPDASHQSNLDRGDHDEASCCKIYTAVTLHSTALHAHPTQCRRRCRRHCSHQNPKVSRLQISFLSSFSTVEKSSPTLHSWQL